MLKYNIRFINFQFRMKLISTFLGALLELNSLDHFAKSLYQLSYILCMPFTFVSSANCLIMSIDFITRSLSRARWANFINFSNATIFLSGWPMLSSMVKSTILLLIPASFFQSEDVGFSLLWSSISFFKVFYWRRTWPIQTGHLQSNPISFLRAVFHFLRTLPQLFTSLK